MKPETRQLFNRKANGLKSVVALGIGLIVLSVARQAPGLPPRISQQDALNAAEQVAQLIEKYYVFPEKRQPIAAAIRRAAADHWYDVDDPYVFADRITNHLRSVGKDAPLAVTYNPDFANELNQHQASGHHHVAPRGNANDRNEGFEEMKILPGNVRYVKITNFMWTDDVTGPVIDEVARFLGKGNAVIIDLRGNGGGNAEAVARLISYFMKDEHQTLMTFNDGMSGEEVTTQVRGDLRAPRMVGKPFYTLIDDGTASAAEEFAYHVEQFKLGSLVGEKTAGAANNNQHFPVQPGFVASVSIGRPVHPVSKTNWEGVGISPTEPTSSASAFDHAQLLALRRLAQNASEAERAAYTWAIEALECRLHPFQPDPKQLDGYAGKYGIRSIRIENGGLVFQREGRSPTKLLPMAPDLFTMATTDQIRVRFRRSGDRITGFDQITDQGEIIPSQRDG